MSMRLLYITNNPKVATIAQKAGVDWIFVDLEYIGKDNRQANRNTVISAHSIEDIKNIKKVITTSKLLVRINPLGEWSKDEINNAIDAGADILMLPFFKSALEVQNFMSLVNKRVKTCLLVETMDAVNSIETILSVNGIDYIHIGLNDIHIERKTNFMFEFLADGYVDILAKKIQAKKIPFGFGGVAKIDSDLLPSAKSVIAEHYRLGSTALILSRSFMNSENIFDFNQFEKEFSKGIKDIREWERELSKKDKDFFIKNKIITQKDTYKVRDILRAKKA